MTARWLTAAAGCALLFVALGLWVTHHPLSWLDAVGASRRGTNVPLAIMFTNSGYGVALTVLASATIVAAVALRLPVRIPVAIIVSQMLSQIAVNFIKELFARQRPPDWLLRHEPGFSYPSGHATTAVVFYGAWLVVLWNTQLPLAIRLAGGVIIVIWALGIGWSRVALAAHYPTDVAGGFLFGLGWLCLTLAIAHWRHFPLIGRPS